MELFLLFGNQKLNKNFPNREKNTKEYWKDQILTNCLNKILFWFGMHGHSMKGNVKIKIYDIYKNLMVNFKFKNKIPVV